MSDDHQILKNVQWDKLKATRALYEDDGYIVEIETQDDGHFTVHAHKRFEMLDDEDDY